MVNFQYLSIICLTAKISLPHLKSEIINFLVTNDILGVKTYLTKIAIFSRFTLQSYIDRTALYLLYYENNFSNFLSQVYYSLIFASHDLGGSPYLNLFLLMIINIPSNACAIMLCNKIGRKPTALVTMVLSSLLCGSIGFVPKTLVAVRLVCAVFGDFLISISFSTIYVWSLEVYTTDVRASAMGFLQVASRVGAASAPWIGQALSYVNPAAPYAVMSGATLLAIFPLILVPEVWIQLLLFVFIKMCKV